MAGVAESPPGRSGSEPVRGALLDQSSAGPDHHRRVPSRGRLAAAPSARDRSAVFRARRASSIWLRHPTAIHECRFLFPNPLGVWWSGVHCSRPSRTGRADPRAPQDIAAGRDGRWNPGGSLLLFSAVYDKAPRAILVCVPFAALVAARGIPLWRTPTTRWVAAIALSVGFLVTGWAGSASIRQDSGTVAAGEWLATRQGDVATSLGPVYVLYVGWDRWDIGGLPSHRRIVDPTTAPNVSALRQEGVRWAVVDVQSLALPGDPALKELPTCGRPQVGICGHIILVATGLS